MVIKEFDSKEEVFSYITTKFKKDVEVITLGGSSRNKKLKKFSDIDFNAFSKKYFKPYYEIILVNKKPVLVSVYSQSFVKGNKIKTPKDQLLIFGEYNDKLEIPFATSKYEGRGTIVRECQLAIDFLFKYARSNNKEILEKVQKRLDWDFKPKIIK